MSNIDYIDVQDLTDHFEDWLRDIEQSLDYDVSDAVMASLIKDLSERGVIKAYTWDQKNGLTFEVKEDWKNVLSY